MTWYFADPFCLGPRRFEELIDFMEDEAEKKAKQLQRSGVSIEARAIFDKAYDKLQKKYLSDIVNGKVENLEGVVVRLIQTAAIEIFRKERLRQSRVRFLESLPVIARSEVHQVHHSRKPHRRQEDTRTGKAKPARVQK